MFKQRWIPVVIALVIVGLSLISYFAMQDDKVITLTKNGFKPSQIEIKIGETVTFRNKTDKMFWPASDIHPYHSDYSAFDPNRPLAIDEEWSFTFDRLGKWNFHDHISPNNTGAITVKSLDGLSGGACYDMEDDGCWTNMIASTLEAEGTDAAFLELKRIHDNNKVFASNCHNYAHDIGLKSYQLFGTDIELSEKTSWCNAGFYHGFMEGFVEDQPDPKKLDEFCTWVGETTNSKFGLAEGHCRHGIGHGSLEALLFDKTFTDQDPIEVVNEAMGLCYSTSHDDEAILMRCISGVYDTFRNWLFNPQSPPSRELVDTVLDFCAVPTEWFIKSACYHEMAKIITYLPNPDYTTKVFDFKKEMAAKDWDEYGPWVMRAFSINFGKKGVKEKTFEELIGFCRTADAELQESCLMGMFDGIQFAGTPGEEYKASSQFCSNDLLTKSEKESCFFYFQEEVYYTYPEEMWLEICSLIPSEFMSNRFCLP